MPRTGARVRVSKGIYRDSGGGRGYEIRVTVGGRAYSRRMPPDATLDELKRARANLENIGRTESPRADRYTLRFDAPRYLKLVQHLASYKERRAHLDAWTARLGDRARHRITAQDVLSARQAWLSDDYAPKTINHRVATLRHLYRTLDGPRAPSPCDDVVPLHVPKTPIVRVSNATILAVDRALQAMEARRTGPPWNAKTRARFRVLVSTGKRPCEIMRAQPGDVDTAARVWVPRDAKGGFTPGVYLNDDMLAAWRLFIEAQAWGPYNTGQFANTIRSAGWPAGVRPYQARHTTWITASELGIDLHDISIGAGHKDPRMTRKAYVPVLNSRLQTMSERLDGRFGGWKTVAPDLGSNDSPNRIKAK
jgi:integrase